MLPVLRAGAADSVVARKAQGPKVYDLDNIGYIDYLGGGGSSVVGFANQFVLDAVKKVLDFGVPVGFHVPHEVDLAETLTRFLPWIGTWWFCRNQDEAMREVLAWARRSQRQGSHSDPCGGARLRIGAGPGRRGPWHRGRPRDRELEGRSHRQRRFASRADRRCRGHRAADDPARFDPAGRRSRDCHCRGLSRERSPADLR